VRNQIRTSQVLGATARTNGQEVAVVKCFSP
jgi:hypothetical protein